jgi:hypothetical protein
MAVQFLFDSLVQDLISVFKLNFCANNPPILLTTKRYSQWSNDQTKNGTTE